MIASDRRLIGTLRQNRLDGGVGVYSVCSAHPVVIQAALELARKRNQVAVIEATCNQVNQDGGYTGITPDVFADQVKRAATAAGLSEHDLILGGDHLGPQPWRNLPAVQALAKATAMVEGYAKAGFRKLHLDCSMSCADDDGEPGDAVVAQRAAQLAVAAEAVAPKSAPPLYVISTEVPPPGGMGEGHGIVPTDPARVLETWRAHRDAFDQVGLGDAFSRVVAIVVQPGVDFGNEDVVQFAPSAAAGLAEAVRDVEGAVYEAHSTDYQKPESYAGLVDMHFAILKVGPAATFALREAIYALEGVAREMVDWNPNEGVRAALEAAMCANPAHWTSHYSGDERQRAYLRHFSYSDRSRYYWTDPAVSQQVDRLFERLDAQPLPLPLISQYLPQHAQAVGDGRVPATALGLCIANIQLALTPYADACGAQRSTVSES